MCHLPGLRNVVWQEYIYHLDRGSRNVMVAAMQCRSAGFENVSWPELVFAALTIQVDSVDVFRYPK